MTAKRFVEKNGVLYSELSRSRHVLYRETGNWYHQLERFPAALCDWSGFVAFESEQEYTSDPRLQIGVEVSVPNGIASHPRYVRVGETT